MEQTYISIGGAYSPPTPEQIREIMQKHKLTGGAVGKLLQINGRQIRYYLSKTDRREMPFLQWALLLFILGEISSEDYKPIVQELQKNYSEG